MRDDQRGGPDPRRGPRTYPPRPSQATYWRRRVVVLAVGIGLLTTIGWAVNGMFAARSTADQGQPSGGTTAVGSVAAHVGRHTPSATASPSARPDPKPSPHHSAKPSPHHSTPPSHGSGRARACAPAKVRLHLSLPQYWYQTGANPRFTVRAISQQARPCRFNMSTAAVSVVVSAAGRRVWSSADCARSGGSDMVVLTSQTPADLHLSWNRKTSSRGCGGLTQRVRPGEYQATAVAGQTRSPTVNLVLGAKGASGP